MGMRPSKGSHAVGGLGDRSAAGKDPAAVTQLTTPDPSKQCAFFGSLHVVGDLQSLCTTSFFYFAPIHTKKQIITGQRFRPKSGCLPSQTNHKHGK